MPRRDALWAVRGLNRAGDRDDLPLLALLAFAEAEPDAHLPPMLLGEEVIEDYRHLTMSLKAHPVSFLRAGLTRKGVVRNGDLLRMSGGSPSPSRAMVGRSKDAPWLLPSDDAADPVPPAERDPAPAANVARRVHARVTVSGLVLVRQRPGSASGTVFMTLEDETGVANIIVWPKVFERLRPIVIGARFMSVTGKLQSESGVIHVVAEKMEDLTAMMGALSRRGAQIESVARADEVKRPQSSRTKQSVAEARMTLPKGRNFH